MDLQQQLIIFHRNAKSLGPCWAALHNKKVIQVISMRVPHHVDFSDFRTSALATLSLIGDVKTGQLYQLGPYHYFLPRPHRHQNRTKNGKKLILPIFLEKISHAK